jgi:RecA-family ATPase
MNTLEPDRDQIEIFFDALFRHSGREGYASLRAFSHDNKPLASKIWKTPLADYRHVIDVAVDMARRAANDAKPAVFCPPIAVFNGSSWQAREQDLFLGLAVSVECDEHPNEARQRLQEILGEATAIVKSGGQWINGADEPEDKLHLHWRLAQPAKGPDLERLNRARALATLIAGGDPSNVPTVHCLRWPGSWHRKDKNHPRLCELFSYNPDAEIELDEALASLEAAAPPQQPKVNGAGAGDERASADWQAHFDNIRKGENLHQSLRDLAAKMIAAGTNAGAVVNQLRALMEASDALRDDRWRDRFDDIPRAVETAMEKIAQGHHPPPEDDDAEPPPLPDVDLALSLTPREWLVDERIPMFNVTLVSGEGSVGKSTLLMQLSGSTVLGKGWIGMIPAQGPVLYVSCEEDHDELRRRAEAVAVHLGSTRQEMIERGLRVLSFAGRDAILGESGRSGIIRATRLFIQIRAEAHKLRPKLIVVDTVADTFGGDEIKRAQARQFITILRGLAIAAGSTVVLVAHPSLTGIKDDTGLSGSTGWHNSVRARAFFKAAPGEDTTLHALEFRKNNYGPPDAPPILLRWQSGVYVVEPRNGTFEQLADEAEMDHLFLKLLRRFAAQARTVSDKPSSTYAPTVFVDEPEAKTAKATKKKLVESMARLFAANKLRALPFGPPSKLRTRIVEVGAPPPKDPSDPPSNVFQLVPTGCVPTPPIPPTPLEGGVGRWKGPAPANGDEGTS